MNLFNVRIEVHSIVRDLIKNIWVIFMAILMGLMGIYIATNSFYTPEYTAKAIIVVNAKSSTTGTYSLFSSSVEMAKVITRVIVDNSVKDKAIEKLGIDEFDGTLKAEVNKGTNFVDISVKSDSPQKSYELLMSVLESYPEFSDNVFQNVVITILKMPDVPHRPSNSLSSVNKFLVVAICTALVAGCVVIISLLRDTVKDEVDFNKKIESKLIGTIPHERVRFNVKHRAENKDKAFIIHNNAFITLGFVENYHKIAAKIEHSTRRNGSKVFSVTSAIDNEGVSTTASNIAISLADRGHKVILIDMNCTEPELFRIFEKKHNEKAEFANLMNGTLKTNEFRLKRYKHSSLYLALNTQPHEEYGEWITSGRLQKILEVFKNQVDYIILDTAAVTEDAFVTDISKLADETLFVVRTDVAFSTDINDALTTLKEVGAKVTGCILNDTYPEISFFTLAGMDESGFQYSFGYGRNGKYNKYNRGGKYGKYGKYGRYENFEDEESEI